MPCQLGSRIPPLPFPTFITMQTKNILNKEIIKLHKNTCLQLKTVFKKKII